jgi:hypothetical protein
MATVTKIDIQSQQRAWRAISEDALQAHPNLRSRVSLNENGSRIGILEQKGRFRLRWDGAPIWFERLDDAELFAAGMLFEREGGGE